MNKLKKTHPFAKFVLTDAIKRSIVFPARTQELEQFYHDLTGLISEIPKHEINVIMGDWNVRLQERLPHESHVVGPHVFRDEHSKIENLNDDQQRNRTEFIMFCQNHDYVVTNTWFEKPVSKLITYRNPTSHTFEPPYNTNKFGQLDFILVNQRWRNSFHNVESSLPQAITSDHKSPDENQISQTKEKNLTIS